MGSGVKKGWLRLQHVTCHASAGARINVGNDLGAIEEPASTGMDPDSKVLGVGEGWRGGRPGDAPRRAPGPRGYGCLGTLTGVLAVAVLPASSPQVTVTV